MRDLCLHQLFEAAADRSPETVALIDGTQEITYAGLERRANQLARHLLRLGAGPETLVGICTARTAGMVVAMLGTLKAGAAYLSLDPAYPRERLAFMLDDAASPVVLTQESLLDRIGESGAPALVCLDRDAAALASESPQRPSPVTGPGSLAYAIYTSGSTGRPKGVAIEHRSAVVLCRWARETFPAEDLAAMLASTSINFDLSVFEIFVPLAWGGTVILAENALALPHLPAASRVRFVNTVPSAIAELVRANALPPSVRTVGLAGEPLKGALVERIYDNGTVQSVYNLYGPSEDTTYSTWARIERGAPGEPSIGRPVDGTELHLLAPADSTLAPIPPGDPGEVYLGGAGLARGYLGRPDLTAERFLPDPFSGRPGARLYRVGDLGRLLPDGEVQFLGRVDHQVKIRGFRIELGEIEAALSRHPAVRECAVVVREGPSGDPRLVAYVASDPTDPTDPKALLAAWLREKLPEHMVPSLFVTLESLPRTPNGKVDRKALPEPDWTAAAGTDRVFAAPRSPAEELLAGIWAEVLGLPRVGIHDHFFALGGHSLLATRVVSRIRETFGVEIPMRRLFELPTVAELAQAVAAARLPEGVQVPLAPVPRDGNLPLSFAQQRLWVIDRLDPGSPAYNIPWAVRLTGALSAGLLARVFAEVVRRHEALRTTFAERDGKPVQVISPATAVALPVVDLSGLRDRSDRKAREIALAEALRPFDLQRGPLLRLGLIRLAERDWLLLMTLHHIVSDDWSMSVLLREVGILYAALSQGLPSPLPELPVQYADFAVWQRGWLQGEVLETQLASWKRELAGAPQVLELPTDRPRPPRKTFRGAARPVVLSTALSGAVRRLCLEAEATPFMVLLAAWSVLLGRHAGQDDLLVGSPIAGRNRREIEDLIGFFVNTLVLRSQLEPAAGFRALVARTRRAALDAFEHQDLPFERLVEELAPERDLARTPLFQVLFAMQNAPGQSLEIPGLAVAPFTQGSPLAKLDLALVFWQEGDGFAGELEHNLDLFDGSTAERLLARFEALLAAAATEPGRPIADLPLLLPQERQQMLREWSDQSWTAPREASFPERFAAAARAFPEAPAVISAEGEAWSYRRLDEASNRLARRLRALGVGLDRAVGICMERSPELIVGVVAVLKAGGVYVPLNPAHPDERLRFQVEDTGATVVLVHAGTRERLPGHLRLLEVDLATCETGDASPLGMRVPPECLCYVIYTSGSTGVPKGVGVPHGAAMLHSAVIAEDDGLGPGERVVQFSSLSFDVSLEQMLPTLISGAAVVLRGEDLANPAEMLSGFARLGITSANLPTAYWHQAVQGWSAEASPLPLRLRVQCVGGEAMLPEAARRWGTLAGPLGLAGVRLINGYGPTETVVTATRYTVPSSIAPGASSVPIGPLLPLRSGAVVDPRGALQPVGVLGELCLGGILARGYVNRPALTAERFVPNPFSEEPGARMYRTGDLARFLPDGSLDYLGRIDRQVKVRGFRIEPGEIEAVLSAHSAVRDCAVVARQDTPGETQLVAYVVLDPTERTDPSDRKARLAAWLREKLPDYMVPGATVLLDSLPLTPNGKVDRKALPAPERTGSVGGKGAAPSDPIEEILAGLWATILQLDHVGVDDNFFALGGHSLLAAQVVSRIRTVLGVELPLRQLFESRTVAGLARAVKMARQDGIEQVSQVPPIVPLARESGLPLSFAQQRLWFLERLHPGTAVFNMPTLYAVSGSLEIAALQKVLAEIVRRHEALRTTIAGPAGSPFQRAQPAGVPELPVADLSALPIEYREWEADRVAERAARLPFSLDRGGSPTRFLLLRRAEADHLFLTVFHHLVSDGVSQGIFERELFALYEAFSSGRPSPLTDPPVQYADYAAWQRRWLDGCHLAAHLAFWRERLAGPLPVQRLPTDRPRPEVPSTRGALRELTLPAELTAAVRELSRREGSTLYITLLTAYLVLLHRATGQRDLPLGTPVSLRDRPEVENLIGMFVNTLVIRAEVTPEASFRTHLSHVRERVLEAFCHQDVPFERLVEELRPERGPHDTPFFQLMFALFARPGGAQRTGGLELRPLDLANGISQFELTLYMFETQSGLVAQVEYRTELFDPETIDRMLGAFQEILAAAVAAPDLPVAELPFRDWLAATPPAAPAEPPRSHPGAIETIAARTAQLEEMRSHLTDEQRERLRQRLRRK